jgi:hypothetical protein
MKYALSGSLLAAAVAVAPVASATTIPGFAGFSSPASASCFVEESPTGAIIDHCSGMTQVWSIPLPTKDGVSTYSPSVTVYEFAVEEEPVYCAAFAQNPDGTSQVSTSWVGGGSGGTYTLALGSITVPTNGSLFVECEMSNTTKVYSVVY